MGQSSDHPSPTSIVGCIAAESRMSHVGHFRCSPHVPRCYLFSVNGCIPDVSSREPWQTYTMIHFASGGSPRSNIAKRTCGRLSWSLQRVSSSSAPHCLSSNDRPFVSHKLVLRSIYHIIIKNKLVDHTRSSVMQCCQARLLIIRERPAKSAQG